MCEYIRFGIAFTILCIASICDLRTHRIPNVLTFGSMIVGIAFTIIFEPASIVPRLICMLVLFVAGMFGIMGLGDIKLLMALAAFNHWKTILYTLGLGSIVFVLTYLILQPKRVATEAKTFASKILTLDIATIGKSGAKRPFAPSLAIAYVAMFALSLWMEI